MTLSDQTDSQTVERPAARRMTWHCFRHSCDPPPRPGDKALCGAKAKGDGGPGRYEIDGDSCVVCIEMWNAGCRP